MASTEPPTKIARQDIDELERTLTKELTTCVLVPALKNQRAYLSPRDIEISFDEEKHIYLLPSKMKKFDISVTGFCKRHIHNSDFNAVKLVRNMVFSDKDVDVDMHAAKLIEWKYAGIFGSLFHAMVEFFFDNVVNRCPHPECHNQAYNKRRYLAWQLEETASYNLSTGILSQTTRPHVEFRDKPIMPCKYAWQNYDIFVKVVLNEDNFRQFLRNNCRYRPDNEFYIKEIIKQMEMAFTVDKGSLKASVRNYRENFDEDLYEYEVDKIINNYYNMAKVLEDLEWHFRSFGNILLHLPLHRCCDIRPEYIAFSEEHGIAGSVDLCMRMRHDPYHLLIYDWKTCKKIFNTFWRDKEQTNQLLDYSCQLHTYANLIRTISSEFIIDLFVVNVTNEDTCIYNVREMCKCRHVFEQFHKPLIMLEGEDKENE